MDFFKTRSFVISAAVVLVSLVFISGYTIDKKAEFVAAQKLITHSNSVISQTLLVSQKMTALISRQRGYLLTNDDDFLREYVVGKEDIAKRLDLLSAKITDNESQVVRVQQIKDLSDDLIERLDSRVQGLPLKYVDEEYVQDIEGKLLEVAKSVLNEEYELLRLRVSRMESIQTSLLMGVFAGFVVTGFFLSFLNYHLFLSRRQGSTNADRLRFALSASAEGIYDWDLATNKIYYSNHFLEMLGYDHEGFGDDIESSLNRIHPDDVEMVNEAVDLFLKDLLSEYSIEFRMFHKMGHVVWVNSRAQIMRDKNNKPIRMIGTHRDISDQKMIEETLKGNIADAEYSSEAKSGFLAHMSHEIRTPLTAISGIAEILYNNMDNFNQRQKDLISTLLTSTKSLKELVTDILDFSKIEKGEIEFDDQYFPLTELISEVISMMAVPANEKSISFRVTDDDVKNIEYFGDKARMRQILVNLIGNAIKFTDEGTVSLLVKKETVKDIDVLNFYIQDTGIGINNDALENIFEEFRQGDNSVSRKYGGTGLGLPISRNLATLMGGDIRVESTEGLGSVFILSLPMKDRTQVYNKSVDPQLKQKINDRLSSAIRDEQTALIVEDYEGNIVILSYLMEEIGLPFDIAKNGQAAIDKWREKHYDIVLMDVQMPVMDGLTATREIRKIEKENGFNPTPIIGMTAHALVQDKNKCIDAGMTDYLSKPIDSIQLKQKILNHIQKDNIVRIKKTAAKK